jgi:sulfhydrogenase subunit beta (sulfur reductase)
VTELSLEIGSSVALKKPSFDLLLSTLRSMGYQAVGPQVEEDILAYSPITSLLNLPRGYTSEQQPGHYHLVYTGHPRYFDITPGPQSWKGHFFPPVTKLFQVVQDPDGWKIEEPEISESPVALVGVRPCELAAILVQDRVFLRGEWSDPIYRTRRQNAFILAVNCLHPCGTCFCASMGTGPKAVTGYDISLTELEDVFLLEIGSEAGRMLVAGLPYQPASAFLLQSASKGIDEAIKHMGRQLPDADDIPDLLLNNLEHPQWDDVAKRCLSCTNCTLVCPTCFCWDATDLQGLNDKVSSRNRSWDSCFNPDYSHITGGNTRPNTRARYRQWLTHKLASWKHQYDVLGCVGCGRCITWCPAGIDLTAEVAAIRKEINS